MKKRIILGILALTLLLFFITSSWALDYKRYKYEGHPEQDCMRVPVIPQTVDNYPSTIKFIFIPSTQNFSVLIYIENSSSQTQIKTENLVKNSTVQVKEQDER